MTRPASDPARSPTGASPMITRLRSLLLGACAAMAATTAFASPPPKHFGGVPFESIPVPRIQPNDHDQVMARRIDLSVGKSIVIDLPRDAAEVFVSEPKVANAVVRTARKVFIIGTGQGTTSVFVTDKNGAQIAALDIGVAKELARELSILREVIKKALPKADIKVTSVGDNFVLAGTVDSALEVQSAIDIANNLVGQSGGFLGIGATSGKVVNALQVRGRDQVMLKVTIAEVQRSVLKQLGINLNGQWNVAQSGFGLVTDQPFSVQRQLLSETALTGTVNGNTATMRALERQGVLRTLAEPTLTAISGESAKFLAGGEVAIPQAETFDVVTRSRTVSVTYKPIGVALNFTPVVMSENRISIRLSTEVTEIDPENSFLLNTTQVPGFRTRKAETTVELPSGAVLASAGLIQQQSRQAINGLPGAMNIPILGTLFRSRDYQRFETELLILVQPFIAKPSTPGQIARPDDGFADATDPSTIFMGRLNRTYGATAKAPAAISKSGRVGFIHD
ncbi:MAG: type II and III secretion system protein family protein [Beijerinckiaceae bacterium]|nr:type II and III secretion system protein family protein [Beijerinckiaceae bacterium]MCZ8299309.1 type II and III secretion system protein family protein [Beijerinckiaceae bacterium]